MKPSDGFVFEDVYKMAHDLSFIEHQCPGCGEKDGLIVMRGLEKIHCIRCSWSRDLNGLERAKLLKEVGKADAVTSRPL